MLLAKTRPQLDNDVDCEHRKRAEQINPETRKAISSATSTLGSACAVACRMSTCPQK